jgi:hypothetical protein
MTLPELVARLCERQRIKPSRHKDLKTAVRYLAAALQTTPDHLTDLATIETTYRDRLRTYLGSLTPPKSAHIVRNTLDNLSHVFRHAHAAGLLAPVLKSPTVRTRGVMRSAQEARATSPYRATNAVPT